MGKIDEIRSERSESFFMLSEEKSALKTKRSKNI